MATAQLLEQYLNQTKKNFPPNLKTHFLAKHTDEKNIAPVDMGPWDPETNILLMVQKSGDHRLVVYPIIYNVLAPSQVVSLGISSNHQP